MDAPFQFGAGANFNFAGVQPAEAARLRQELALAHSALVAAHAESGSLRAALAATRAETNRSHTAESVARGALNQLREEYKILERKVAENKMEPTDDYERIAELQKINEELLATNRELREQLSTSRNNANNIQLQLEKSDRDVKSRQEQLTQSRSTIEKYKQDLDHEKAAGAERDVILNKAYADLKAVQDACLTALKEKDDMELEKKETELQFSDLHKQFEEERIKNEDIQDLLHQIEQLEAENEGLQADIDRLHEQDAEHDRAVIVKDERIAHLEAQYQKERQRNLNAADAVAAAVATSPIDEAPPALPGLAESLAEELSAASDEYDEFDYEHDEAGSVAPIEGQSNTTSVSTQTDVQDLTTAILHAVTLETVPITPIAITTTATSTQTVAPKLTSCVLDNASISTAPVRAKDQRTTASFAPVKITHDEAPLDARPSRISTASTGAQTTEIITKPTETATQTPAPVVLDSKPRKLSLLQRILPIIAAVLAFFCLMLYTEVQAWRTANGVGFGYGHGGSYSRSGAYGNGRYIFGFIPLAMDVGNSWWSEQVAKYASVGITAFEEWAGISYAPLY